MDKMTDGFLNETAYLKAELTSEVKHEYVDGRVFAMAGASRNHERISVNILAKFGHHLENTPCEPFGSDMKLRTPTGRYRYPDGMVICEETSGDDYFTESPVIIIEVLSRTTRKTDEQTKRLEYINIPTLQEYVLIEQDVVDVEVFRKRDQWRPTHYFLGDEVRFESIDLTLTVEAIYHRVQNQDVAEFLALKDDI